MGCSATDETSSTAPAAAAVDLCALAAPSGAASDAVSVAGPVGSPVSITAPTPLVVASTQRTVVVQGTGDVLDGTSLVQYAMTAFDASTAARLSGYGYDGESAPPASAASIGQYLGCATVGSRVVVAVPAEDSDDAAILVIDVLGVIPGRAIGQSQAPVAGMPTVALAADGTPTVAIPPQAPPTSIQAALLTKGGGAVVAAGDTVTLQYVGVRWSNGAVFESSWSAGAPTSVITTDLLAGYRGALEGQTVGSQIVVVLPPAAAYGEGEINEVDLTGETIVFVVDILDTQS